MATLNPSWERTQQNLNFFLRFRQQSAVIFPFKKTLHQIKTQTLSHSKILKVNSIEVEDSLKIG